MAPSIWQILIVVLIILMLFGAGKLPQVMGDMAKGIKSFKKGLKEDDEEDSEKSSPKVIEAEPAHKTEKDKDRTA